MTTKDRFKTILPSSKAKAVPAPMWKAYRASNPKPMSRRDQIRAGLRTRKFVTTQA